MTARGTWTRSNTRKSFRTAPYGCWLELRTWTGLSPGVPPPISTRRNHWRQRQWFRHRSARGGGNHLGLYRRDDLPDVAGRTLHGPDVLGKWTGASFAHHRVARPGFGRGDVPRSLPRPTAKRGQIGLQLDRRMAGRARADATGCWQHTRAGGATSAATGDIGKVARHSQTTWRAHLRLDRSDAGGGRRRGKGPDHPATQRGGGDH